MTPGRAPGRAHCPIRSRRVIPAGARLLCLSRHPFILFPRAPLRVFPPHGDPSRRVGATRLTKQYFAMPTASRRRDAVGDVDHPTNASYATAIITKRAFYAGCPGIILGSLITS